MSALVAVLLGKALVATFLAVVAAAASRVTSRASILHAFWLVVLLELLSPPIVRFGTVPDPFAPAAIAAAEHAPVPATAVAPSAPELTLGAALLVLWAAGSLLVLLVVGARHRAFARSLRDAQEALDTVQRRAESVAATLGLRRCPPVCLVRGRLSPMLWLRGSGLVLLLPAELVRTLPAAELDALLAHELAHVRRRDHLVRLVEVAASSAFWWHPVVWWSRRRIRRAEERACDARVLEAFPEAGPAYARAVLATVEFLSSEPRRVPALSCGIGPFETLKERLTMIVAEAKPKRVSPWLRAVAAPLAAAVLLVVPTWADPREEPTPQAAAPAAPGAGARDAVDSARAAEALARLDAQARELERALTLVHAQAERIARSANLKRRQPALERAALDAARAEIERASARLAPQARAAGLDAAREAERRAEVLQKRANADQGRAHDEVIRTLRERIRELERQIEERNATESTD